MSLTFVGIVAGVVAASCYTEHIKKKYANKKEFVKKEYLKPGEPLKEIEDVVKDKEKKND